MNFPQELYYGSLVVGDCLFVFFYLEEGLDGRQMAVTFSSAMLIHTITNLFYGDRRDCKISTSDITMIFKRFKLSNNQNKNTNSLRHTM